MITPFLSWFRRLDTKRESACLQEDSRGGLIFVSFPRFCFGPLPTSWPSPYSLWFLHLIDWLLISSPSSWLTDFAWFFDFLGIFFSEFLEASAPLPLLPGCLRSLLGLHRALELSGAPYTKVLPVFFAKSSEVSFSKVQFLLLALAQSLIISVILDLAFNTLISNNWSPFVWNFDIFLPYLEVTLCLWWFRVSFSFSSHLSVWVKTFVRRFKGLLYFSF